MQHLEGELPSEDRQSSTPARYLVGESIADQPEKSQKSLALVAALAFFGESALIEQLSPVDALAFEHYQ
jgi:hypothetical protein